MNTKQTNLLKYSLILTLFVFPEFAFAASNPVVGALEWLLNLLVSDIGRIAAMIAVVVLGIGSFVGYFNFQRAGMIVMGIVLIFGAAWFVDSITASAS